MADQRRTSSKACDQLGPGGRGRMIETQRVSPQCLLLERRLVVCSVTAAAEELVADLIAVEAGLPEPFGCTSCPFG